MALSELSLEVIQSLPRWVNATPSFAYRQSPKPISQQVATMQFAVDRKIKESPTGGSIHGRDRCGCPISASFSALFAPISVTPDAGLVGQDSVIFYAEVNPNHTRYRQARKYAARASSRSSRYRVNSLCPARPQQGSGI
jgi:hypothetical protein